MVARSCGRGRAIERRPRRRPHNVIQLMLAAPTGNEGPTRWQICVRDVGSWLSKDVVTFQCLSPSLSLSLQVRVSVSVSVVHHHHTTHTKAKQTEPNQHWTQTKWIDMLRYKSCLGTLWGPEFLIRLQNLSTLFVYDA